MIFKRVFIIVLDSFGIGEAPDAANFGDKGSNTLLACSKSKYFDLPHLKKCGLFNIDGVSLPDEENPDCAFGRLAEKSAGKDTTIGHWEIAGLISEKPLPTYPNGFPESIIKEFEKISGRKVICNKPYSGTQVIKDYGDEQAKTGALIVYTSADSVFQIAANEDIIEPKKLYEYCEQARKILKGEHAVGRVIARPFVKKNSEYVRTANRHDFSLAPPENTMLDLLNEKGFDTLSIGKIYDIFAHRGISDYSFSRSNSEGMNLSLKALEKDFTGLCFTNLVDFDMLYGHRNDTDGYAKALCEFDKWLPSFKKKMRSDDLLIITADHGCDPSTKSTDHSRECVPLILSGEKIKPTNLGTLDCFSVIAKTICDNFGIENNFYGESLLGKII